MCLHLISVNWVTAVQEKKKYILGKAMEPIEGTVLPEL